MRSETSRERAHFLVATRDRSISPREGSYPEDIPASKAWRIASANWQSCPRFQSLVSEDREGTTKSLHRAREEFSAARQKRSPHSKQAPSRRRDHDCDLPLKRLDCARANFAKFRRRGCRSNSRR